MKKLFALLLALALLFSAALADASIEVVHTLYQLIPHYDSSVGVYCAEIINTGNTLIALNGEQSRVDVMDADGQVLATESIYSTAPAAIGPGETGYVVSSHMYLDDVDVSALTDYAIHLYAEKANYYEPTNYLDPSAISADIRTEIDSWGSEVTSLYITFTNTTADVVYNFNFAVGVYDESGALIYACESSTYDVGVPAGQTVIILSAIDDTITSYWAENGVTPSTIDVIGYRN